METNRRKSAETAPHLEKYHLPDLRWSCRTRNGYHGYIYVLSPGIICAIYLPGINEGPFDPKEYEYWMPVDIYTGGIEHANMHLIYTRFFHKALHSMDIVPDNEPMLILRNQGMVLGEDSEKMSKSRGNVVAPDKLVQQYGADTVRAYLMFFARWEQGGPWSSTGIDGTARWVRRVWALFTEPAPAGEVSPEMVKALRRKLHQTLRSITRDFEKFEFNTIISSLMELLNEMFKAKQAGMAREEVGVKFARSTL